MSLETHWALTSNFVEIPSLQANGAAGLTGTMMPDGIKGRLFIAPDPYGDKGNVMHSVLYETDEYSGNGNRSEIANSASEYDEYWYSWWVMLGDDWGDLSMQCSLMQMHDSPDEGDGLKTPSFLLGILSSHLRIIVPDTLPTENQIFIRRASQRIIPKRWYHLCLHVNWKTSSAGFREVFVDGVPIWREFGIATNFTDVKAPFLKLGVYNGLSAPSGWVRRTAYYSDVRIWRGPATYEQGLNRELAIPIPLLSL